MSEHNDLLYWVSIFEDDIRTLETNSVHARENILKPSSGKVESGSKHVGDKCGKIDAVNDMVKSEAGKVEESDSSRDMMKLNGQDVAEKGCKDSPTKGKGDIHV